MKLLLGLASVSKFQGWILGCEAEGRFCRGPAWGAERSGAGPHVGRQDRPSSNDEPFGSCMSHAESIKALAPRRVACYRKEGGSEATGRIKWIQYFGISKVFFVFLKKTPVKEITEVGASITPHLCNL